MPNFLQRALSPRPPRTFTAEDNPFLAGTGVEYTFTREDNVDVVFGRYDARHKACKGGKSAPCAPPMHIHLEQAEHFTVLEGEMGAVMDGKEVFLKPGDGEYVSSAGQAHTFWPVVDAGDLHVKVKATPGDVQGFDEKFFRNFQSYLYDCEKHNVSPSIPQLVLFLWSGGIVLGLPFPLFVNKAICYFLGPFLGGTVLGYKTNYPEYWTEKKDI